MQRLSSSFLKHLALVLTLLPFLTVGSHAAPVNSSAYMGVRNESACWSKGAIGVANDKTFFAWLGRTSDFAMDYAWFETWQNMIGSTSSLLKCWRAGGFTKISFSVAMIPSDHTSTMAAGAAGAYDAYYQQIAQALVANGYGDAIVRIGWEFNIPNWPWSAAKDPAHFIALWQRIVTVMRSVPGANFKFDWCYALDMATRTAQNGRVYPDAVYPGDEYVDIIGVDFYNRWWGPVTDAAHRWERWVNYKYGLQWQANFAASHRKHISFPEWGTGNAHDGSGLGDDPDFITYMATWIGNHDVVYQDYWDENMHNGEWMGQIDDGQFPKAAAALQAAFSSRAQ